MGNSFRKMFDKLFGNREMRVRSLHNHIIGRPGPLVQGDGSWSLVCGVVVKPPPRARRSSC